MAEPEDSRAKRRAYYAANAEKICAQVRAYRAANLAKVRALTRAARAVAPEKARARTAAYNVAHPLYVIWGAMLTRCYKTKSRSFKNYGGRGIVVCDRWREAYAAFEVDMLPSYRPGLTLERIDNDGNYTPENCLWATPKEQGRNKRNNVVIDTPAGPMLLVEAAEQFGLRYNTLVYRRLRGQPLFAPLRRKQT